MVLDFIMSHSYLAQSGNVTFKQQIRDTLLKKEVNYYYKILKPYFEAALFLVSRITP